MENLQIRGKYKYILATLVALTVMGASYISNAQTQTLETFEFLHSWAGKLNWTKKELNFGEDHFHGYRVWMGLDQLKKSCTLIYQHYTFDRGRHWIQIRLERATHLEFGGHIPGAPDGTQGVIILVPGYRFQNGEIEPRGRAPELRLWEANPNHIFFEYNSHIENYFDRKNPRPPREHQEGTLEIILDDKGNPTKATFENKGNDDTLECRFGNLY